MWPFKRNVSREDIAKWEERVDVKSLAKVVAGGSSPELEAAAVKALGRTYPKSRDGRALDILRDHLTHKDRGLRWAAAKALSCAPDPSSAEQLFRAIENVSEDERNAAHRNLTHYLRDARKRLVRINEAVAAGGPPAADGEQVMRAFRQFHGAARGDESASLDLLMRSMHGDDAAGWAYAQSQWVRQVGEVAPIVRELVAHIERTAAYDRLLKLLDDVLLGDPSDYQERYGKLQSIVNALREGQGERREVAATAVLAILTGHSVHAPISGDGEALETAERPIPFTAAATSERENGMIPFGEATNILEFPSGFERQYLNHLKLIGRLIETGAYPKLEAIALKAADARASCEHLIVVTGTVEESRKLPAVFYAPEAEELVRDEWNGDWSAVSPRASIANVADPGTSVDLLPFERLVGEIRQGRYEVERSIGGRGEPDRSVAPRAAPRERAVPPDSLSFVAFVSGSGESREPEAVFEHILSRKFTASRPEVLSWHVVDVSRPVSDPERALDLYRQRVERGELPELGEPFDEFHETLADGKEIFAVFFR